MNHVIMMKRGFLLVMTASAVLRCSSDNVLSEAPLQPPQELTCSVFEDPASCWYLPIQEAEGCLPPAETVGRLIAGNTQCLLDDGSVVTWDSPVPTRPMVDLRRGFTLRTRAGALCLRGTFVLTPETSPSGFLEREVLTGPSGRNAISESRIGNLRVVCPSGAQYTGNLSGREACGFELVTPRVVCGAGVGAGFGCRYQARNATGDIARTLFSCRWP
jgi:hypothetical protein